MKVNIHHEGKSGWVQYDPLGKEVLVSHPNEEVRNTVHHYLSNERRFTMPASDKIGHKMMIDATPTDSKGHMDMALSEMYHATGVHVNWGHEEHDGGLRNEKADKPILKSLSDDTRYIIREE